MISCHKRNIIPLLLLASSENELANAFSPSLLPRLSSARTLVALSVVAEGLAPAAVKETRNEKKTKATGVKSIDTVSAEEAKRLLIDLVPRMTGKEEEYRAVESYVDLLEETYAPVQTLGFLNLAMAGEWQLLFSTNLTGRPNRNLRLRELVQKIETEGLKGSIRNLAQWEYAEDEETFDAYGLFSINCSYSINQGSRMIVDLNDHEIRPAKGSAIPKDVPRLVGLLRRAIPKEMFDPNGHAIDTSYLDVDLRIVRYTGPNHEGVRNIFIRKGSLEINPV